MIGSLYPLLCAVKSPAATGALLEALRLGDADEREAVAETLLQRGDADANAGLIASYRGLPESVRAKLVERRDALAPALRRLAREHAGRAGVTAFIADAGGANLIDILGELLASRTPSAVDAAAEAAAGLARSDDSAVRAALADVVADALGDSGNATATPASLANLTRAAVALMSDGEPGPLGALVRKGGPRFDVIAGHVSRGNDAESAVAALAIAEASPRGKAVLQNAVAAAASRPALDALLANGHRLLLAPVATAARDVAGGRWSTSAGIRQELHEQRRVDGTTTHPADAATVASLAQWVAASAIAGEAYAEQCVELALAAPDVAAKLAILRAADGRERAGRDLIPLALLGKLSSDADVAVVRAAVRKLADRVASPRSPQDAAEAERLLVRACGAGDASVRAAGRRGLGNAFARYWSGFDRLSPAARTSTGRAVAKLVPDFLPRLRRLAASGPAAARLRALAVADASNCVPPLAAAVLAASRDGDARLRSKAALLLGRLADRDDAKAALDLLLDDADPRVRANALESLPAARVADHRDLVLRLASSGEPRERANAVVRLGELGDEASGETVGRMLRDPRDAHRLSGVWAVERAQLWPLLGDVVALAKADRNASIRRSALSATRRIAGRFDAKPALRAAAALAGLTLVPALASAQTGHTADAIRAGFNAQGEAGSDLTGPVLAGAVMLAAGGTAIALIVRKVRQTLRRRKSGDAGLEAAVRRTLRLSRGDMVGLRRLAGIASVEHPTTLLLCPSLLRKLRARVKAADQRSIDRLLLRLCGA